MSKNNLQYFLLGLILLVHAVLLTKLIFFPYPELFIYPYLTNQGLKPYSQILDQHFPGLMFLPINFDNLGMTNEVIARAWLIGSVIITQLLLFFISRSILKNGYKALLVNLLYLVWQPFFEGWVLWIDSFLPLILLPAFYTFLKKRFLMTGLFIGIGIVFKQVLIPLAGLTLLYVIWTERNWKSVRAFLLGLFFPIALMLAYFASRGVLGDFWYWTVIFNLTTYAEFGRGTGPTLAHFSRVTLVFGIALLLLIFQIRKKEGQILLIFFLGALFGLSTRFDFVHFQPALPFAVLTTVYGLERFGRLGGLGVLGYILVASWWLVIFYQGHLGSRVISFDSGILNLANKIRNYTNPREKIFVFGAAPQLYQMTETLPAGDIFVFQFPWFLKVAEDRILAGIKKDRPEIVVSDGTVEIEGESIKDYAEKIDKYIQENYEKIDSVGSTEILRRK